MSDAHESRKAGERRHRVRATEAAKTFGRLVNRVREERATYIIERGGQAVAQIGPVEHRTFTVADFREFVETATHASEAHARAVAGAVSRHNKPSVRRNPWAR
jgi:hypothetical protein